MPIPALDVGLRAAVPVVLSDARTELVLVLNARQTMLVPTSFLSGVDLQTTIGGKPGPRIRESVPGETRLAVNTRLERRITVDIAPFAAQLQREGFTRIRFQWASAPEVVAELDVAPNLEKVSVDRLDLARTRVILLTSHGTMLLKLHPDKAPKTVRNFVELAKNRFYDGTRFHRVVRGFMIQGGCPNTKAGAKGKPGTGTPGHSVVAEFNETLHVRGVVSMARASDKDSAGCQFFIVHAKSPHLDGNHTAFGELVAGADTLDRIASVEVGGPTRWGPLDPVHLHAAIVEPAFKQE